MPCIDDDCIKCVPCDGAVAFKAGFRRNQNPFLTQHMRAKWREAYMTAEAESGDVADCPVR